MTQYKVLIKWKNSDLTTDTDILDDWALMLRRVKNLRETYKDSIVAIYFITWQPEMLYKPIVWPPPKIFYTEKE